MKALENLSGSLDWVRRWGWTMRVSIPGWSQSRCEDISLSQAEQVPYLCKGMGLLLPIEGEGWDFYIKSLFQKGFLFQKGLGTVSREIVVEQDSQWHSGSVLCAGLWRRTILYSCFCCFKTKGLHNLVWEKELWAWGSKD